MAEAGRLSVGTSGFRYPDWVGPVYPPGTPARRMLEEYATLFSCVEINSTYYAIPAPATMESLLSRTGTGFLFTVKLPGSITHQGDDPSAYEAAFYEGVRPLVQGGRLAALVAQFPWSFRNSPAARDRLLRVCLKAREIAPVVVEFRHNSWVGEQTYRLLAEEGLAWCSVDEPELPGLLPREMVVLSGLAYLRFHSRDGGRWWSEDGKERYHYRYTLEELDEWVPKIGRARMEAGQVFVFFNNCHAGHAARNAVELLERLGEAAGLPGSQGTLF